MVDRSKGIVTSIPQAQNPKGSGDSYNLQYSGYGYESVGGYAPGIITGTPADWFGPLNPMAPSAPPEVRGRQFDFPSGYNLNVGPRAYEPIKFSDLRALADSYDILRTVIETRKDQMVRLKWNIKPREDAYGKKLAKPDDPILTEIRDFFTMPDGEQFWDGWLREILEDLFVLDAPVLFTRRNRAGKLQGLDPIDGSTIKRVIDNYGRTPKYPVAAYQQELHGLPAVNYTTQDMIYRPRNVRSHKVYGYGPVEQIVMTINIALRRQIFLLQYYTEGNVPEALIGAPDNWSSTQIREFQSWFDGTLSGNTAERRRARFIPGGTTYHNIREGALTGETDEWLTRVCCFAFSITPTPFIKQVNRATAESQKQQAIEEGLAPVQMWVKSLIDYIIWTEWKRRDIEFGWEMPDDVNPKDQSEVLDKYVRNGVYSINQALDKLGEDPIEGGDQHLALLPTGWVPIAPTNQFGAAGGAQGVGEVNDDIKAKGNVKVGRDPVDTTPPKEPGTAPDPKVKPVKEVGKLADVPFGIGLKKLSKPRLLSVPIDRSAFHDCEKQITDAIATVFATVSIKAKEQIIEALRVLNKASIFDGPIAAKIAEMVDLSGLTEIPAKIVEVLRSIGANALSFILDEYNGSMAESAAIAQVDAWALSRSAELVGMEYDAYGNLIADAAADMAIDTTTVTMIERLVASGMNEGLTADLIADGIEATVFGADRAALIGYAETVRASSAGAMIGAQAIESLGETARKGWRTAGDSRVCLDVCAQNELDGYIKIDDPFSSGDQMTPGHPRCRCNTIFQVFS